MLRTPLFILTLTAFLISFAVGPLPIAQADDFHLPAPGVMVHLSPPLDPPILKGIKVHPNNPFQFEFILDRGDNGLSNDDLKDESAKLIKYFLASLTIPEKDLWVNLSPYEKDRIIPQSFGLTEMGRDLLAEDYMLKQITASLIYPEDEVGKKFWKRIYEEASKRYGTTNIPVNTFNKVWIVPEKAVVFENAKEGTAYVVESKLKVMLEEDYLSLEKHAVETPFMASHNKDAINRVSTDNDVHTLGSNIVREIVIPELTKEVNENKNFAKLRQVYNSLILATWYKKKIKDSILSQIYADKNKTAGVQYTSTVIPAKAGIQQKNDVELIYQRYLKAFKKGVFNFIKEEVVSEGLPSKEQGIFPRKYFSGGMNFAEIGSTNLNASNAMTVINRLSNPVIASFALFKPLLVTVAVTGVHLTTLHPLITLGQVATIAWLVRLFSNFQKQERTNKNEIEDQMVLPQKRPKLLTLIPQGNSLNERAQRQSRILEDLISDDKKFSIYGTHFFDQGKNRKNWRNEVLIELDKTEELIRELKTNESNEKIVLELQNAIDELKSRSIDKMMEDKSISQLRNLAETINDFPQSGGYDERLKWLMGGLNGNIGALNISLDAHDFIKQFKRLRSKEKGYAIDEKELKNIDTRIEEFQALINPLEIFVNHVDNERIDKQLKNEEPIEQIQTHTITSAKKLATDILGSVTIGEPIKGIPSNYTYDAFTEKAEQLKTSIDNEFYSLQRMPTVFKKGDSTDYPVRLISFLKRFSNLNNQATKLEQTAFDTGEERFVQQYNHILSEPKSQDDQEILTPRLAELYDALNQKMIDFKLNEDKFSNFKTLIKESFTRQTWRDFKAALKEQRPRSYTPSPQTNQAMNAGDLIIHSRQVYNGIKNLVLTNRKINNAKSLGGIDLTPANMNLQTQNAGEAIKFHMDPAMLAQLQNAPGFTPVIINIQPLNSIQRFLGISENQGLTVDS